MKSKIDQENPGCISRECQKAKLHTLGSAGEEKQLE